MTPQNRIIAELAREQNNRRAVWANRENDGPHGTFKRTAAGRERTESRRAKARDRR